MRLLAHVILKENCFVSQLERLFFFSFPRSSPLLKSKNRVGMAKRRLMSTTQLVDFLNKTQRDPRLNEILHPYANPARAKDIIQEYEPNKFNAQKGQLSFDGFLR